MLALPPPGTAYRFKTGAGWTHPRQVVPVIAALARQDSVDPTLRAAFLGAVHGLDRDDYDGEARAILDLVQSRVRYTHDPEGHEYVQAPRHTLTIGAGDCDDIAGVVAAGIRAIGRRHRFVVSAWPRDPSIPKHIWAEMQSPGGWITIDPVPRPARLGIGAAVDGAKLSWDDFGREVQSMQGYAANAIGFSKAHRHPTPASYQPRFDGVQGPQLIAGPGAYDMEGFWASVWGGIKKVGKIVGPIAKVVGAIYPPAGAAIAAVTAVASGVDKIAGGGSSKGGKGGKGAAAGPAGAAASAASGLIARAQGAATIVSDAASAAAGAARGAARAPSSRAAGAARGAARAPSSRAAGAARAPSSRAAAPRQVRPAGAMPRPRTGYAGAAGRAAGAAAAQLPTLRPADPAVSAFAAALEARRSASLIAQAQRAAQSFGLGADDRVMLVSDAEQARIAAGLPGQAALLASRDLKTRARQTNYALTWIGQTHDGTTWTLSRVAERIMAFRKALGTPAVAVYDPQIRQSIQNAGDVSSAPSVADVARAVRHLAGGPGSPQAAAPSSADAGAPVLITPAPGPSSTPGPAGPIAQIPGLTTAGPGYSAGPIAAGAGPIVPPDSTTPTQILPPGGEPTGKDNTKIALIALIAVVLYKRRRR